jgi:sigma-B regulation protein RsbU (phosphoserine phosphatase)
MFTTLFFGVLDPATGILSYINGGHNPPVLIGPTGLVKARLKPTGPLVGLFPGMDFGIKNVTLEPGDLLLAFTDGVPDARDLEGELFGEERLLSLAAEPASSVAALLDRIETSLQGHIGEADQFDDITMLAVRRAPKRFAPES